MAGFLDDNRPDFGQMSMDSAELNSAERNSGVAAMSDMATTGIGAQAAAEAAEIGAAAAASAAADSATGSMLSDLGSVIGGGIGTMGKFNYGKTKMGAGGGNVGGYGTLGPNYGIFQG